MLLHFFPTYSHLYIFQALTRSPEDAWNITSKDSEDERWMMSQPLLFDAATNTVQLGPFGVGSKGSANNFVFFSKKKQTWMLNSNKISDTHGRLDSCYSRYVALKKSVLGSQAWARRTPALWWWHIMWNDACDVLLGVGSNIDDIWIECFLFSLVSCWKRFPMICLLFPMISGLFPVVKAIRIWPHGSGFFVDELQGQHLLSLAFLPDKISWDPGTNKWACLKIRDLQIQYIFFSTECHSVHD